MKKISLIVVLLIVIVGIVFLVYKAKDNHAEIVKRNIVIYEGYEILKETGVQAPIYIEINEENKEKYKNTYYNYEEGMYKGEKEGLLGEEIYDGVSLVCNVNKIAMTEKYDAIPRKFKEIEELPEKLNKLVDYTRVEINEIDLDGNGKNEYLVACASDYKIGETDDGEPQAFSTIMLFDDNYEKIADLATLENGFWANIKEEEQKIFLSLKDVEYIDIDNDGIMEIIIQIPQYEGFRLSILKYSENKLKGETDIEVNLDA